MTTKKTTKARRFTIKLVVKGDASAAREAVEASLDAGDLQDAVNTYDHDAGPLKVISALVTRDTEVSLRRRRT
jgi:hypothetical protein